MRLRLGTRGSALALAQSGWAAERLAESHPGLIVEMVHIVTGGDRSQASETPLSASSEKGVFANEIEAALLADEIDFAVHSLKDLAATLPAGLVIAAVPAREDPRDVLVGATLASLPSGARIGTGSVRRRALLQEMRPDLDIREIRGNVDTRLRKLENGDYDAIVLAAAGLKRLGRSEVIAERLDPLTFIPDPGQGALAIQAREDRQELRGLLAALHNRATAECVTAERAFLLALGGGCSTPIGAWANYPERVLTLHAMLADERGQIRRVHIVSNGDGPQELGNRAAAAIESDK